MKKKTQGAPAPNYVKWLWYAALTPFVLLAAMLTLTALGAFGHMPSFEELENPRSNIATEIYSEDGKVLGTFFVQNRSYVQYEELFASGLGDPHLDQRPRSAADRRGAHRHRGRPLRLAFGHRHPVAHPRRG